MAKQTVTPGDEREEDPRISESDDMAMEDDAMERFVQIFEASARRWELVVYPAMLAFVVLAGYGFFLIYSLSKDIHIMAQGMDPQMAKNLSSMSDSVIYLSENVRTMTRRVHKMSVAMEGISGKMDALQNLEPMLTNMRGMNASTAGMGHSVERMTRTGDAMNYELGNMSQSLRPMRVLGDFVP